MKTITCDVCGMEIDTKDQSAVLSEREGYKTGNALLRPIVSGMDLCSKCVRVGEQLDIKKIVVSSWKMARSEQTLKIARRE